MAAGLFELRKDPITGWWVATVVDRAFHRDRFARAAEQVDDRLFGCANCTNPAMRTTTPMDRAWPKTMGGSDHTTARARCSCIPRATANNHPMPGLMP